MQIKDKKILITGGAGFIGSNLVDYFLENQNEVIVVDDLSTGNLINLKYANKSNDFKFIKADIRNKYLIKDIIQNSQYIFHEAAIASVPLSIKEPLRSNDVNVNGTLNILNLAKDSSVQRIILASSSSIYGDAKKVPIEETSNPSPLSPYGVTKLVAELYCQRFYKIYGLKVAIIRYFNVYGKRQADSPYSGVIPIWFDRLLKNKSPIIYGNGNQTRDFVYIKDIIKINELCALRTSAIGEIFNGGTSNEVKLSNLLNLMKLITGKEIDPILETERPGDIKHSIADISKARKILGFEPKYDIEKGLTDFLNYLKNFTK